MGRNPVQRILIDVESKAATLQRLESLLEGDLDFHDQDSSYASHNFHAFPAKFPPQLPRKFISALTEPGDVVLDPMMGSGTTVVEALLAGRQAVGFDIDPLAILLTRVKVAHLDSAEIDRVGHSILERATEAVKNGDALASLAAARWDGRTRQFIDYWFARETQIELAALVAEIERIPDAKLREFFQVVFSSIIITKSGGVSLAFDLAHTRPHRAKVVRTKSGEILLGHDLATSKSRRVKLLSKTLRSPLEEFEKRLDRNRSSLLDYIADGYPPDIRLGDAQQLPIEDDSVDLIVTSPPYISNAIDYMRAHKFSLVWLGYSIEALGRKRKEYIGGEATVDTAFVDLPDAAAQVVASIAQQDKKKGQVVHRYYSEMTRVLREMHRVLKPGSAAIVVVGTSIIRGIDTQVDACLAEIGRSIGFDVPKIGVRHLDRNRRMLPAGAERNPESQIQQRMHEEYVLGFCKP